MPILKLKDCDLHYEVTGDGPALLFIHGLGSCRLDWDKQVEAFSRKYRVITCDLRGHGDSSRPPGPYGVKLFAQDQRALLEVLKVDSVDVIGVSLGGAVAFQLAIDAPALVRRLVIVNSYPEFILRTWAQKFFIWQRIAMIKLLSFEKMGKIVANKMFPGLEQETVRQTFVRRYIRNERRPYLDALNGLFGWSIADRLDELRCPVLVIAADQDYSPVSSKEEYVRKLRRGKLVVIPDSRHATPMERPEEFNTVLADFLSEPI